MKCISCNHDFYPPKSHMVCEDCISEGFPTDWEDVFEDYADVESDLEDFEFNIE